jgi:hypothetical protein
MSKSIDKSIRETIAKSDLPGVIQDLGELSIDSLLDDGVLRDVPILGSLLSIGKTFGTVRDYILAKKLLSFLNELSGLSQAERDKLINKLEKDKEYEANIGEIIVDLLSRTDSDQKPILIAKAFKLYVQEKINYVELQRVNYAIERFQLCDLEEFKEFVNDGENDRKTDERASTANFVNSGLGYAASGFGAGGVHPTETAKILMLVLNL